MDYEKKYKEALERAKEIIECSKNSGSKEVRMVLSFFPELKENESEIICRKLIAFLKQCKAVYGDGFKQFGLDIDDAIAWLRKQGEQKQVLLTKEKALKNSPFVEQKPNCCDEQKPKTHNGSDNPYDMSYPDAEGYISKRGFDIPWNNCDVFVDERYITQTVANVLKWADDYPDKHTSDTDAFIEKAEKWLKENIYKRVYKQGDCLGFPTAEFLEEFKKYMKGE